MLQPTDRVLAKTFVNIAVDIIANIIPNEDPKLQAMVLTMAVVDEGKRNPELLQALIDLVREVRIEAEAEANGTAVSVDNGPVAQPWNDDVGSGY